MPHFSDLPRYIIAVQKHLLVVTRVTGRPTASDRLITKVFKGPRFGNTDGLLAEAVRWRDRAWRRIFGGSVPARSFHERARSKSITGTPGVRFVTKAVKSKSRPHTIPYVMAEVHTVPGKDYKRPTGSRSKLFSLHKYDVEEAVTLAAEWRAAMLNELLTSST